MAAEEVGELGVDHDERVVLALLLPRRDLGDLRPLGEIELAPGQAPQFASTQTGVGEGQVDPAPIQYRCRSSQNDGVISFQRLTVRMGQTPLDTLGSTFANNRPATRTTVLDVQRLAWPVRAGEWTDLGLGAAFDYTPALGNLFVEVQATAINTNSNVNFQMGQTQPGSVSVAVAADYSGSPPGIGGGYSYAPLMRIGEGLATSGWLGQGCAGSTGTSPALGKIGRASCRGGET